MTAEKKFVARQDLQRGQLARLNELLAKVLPENRFYADRWGGAPRHLKSLEQLSELPLLTKTDLRPTADATSLNLAAHHSYPVESYARWHRTSGTHGAPLNVLDTADDWRWWIETWQAVLDAAEVRPGDRAVMLFSFGPFIGFWSAYEALAARGAVVVPAGGLSTSARLQLLLDARPAVIGCTPSYALHVLAHASAMQIPLPSLGIRSLIVAGEPGGSLPSLRDRLEQGFGARVIDHAGATEVGPWGVGRPELPGLHVIEREFIAEFLQPDSNRPAAEGELSELVLTALGRYGAPAIRYRTGDLVLPRWNTDFAIPSPHDHWVWLEGGVRGRVDDMLVIRGVNIFPSSIEAIVRQFPEIGEYRLIARRRGQLDELTVELECDPATVERIGRALQAQLGLRVETLAIPAGTMTASEGKARRFVDLRSESTT
jgi:phenylacetate-CoA ligase